MYRYGACLINWNEEPNKNKKREQGGKRRGGAERRTVGPRRKDRIWSVCDGSEWMREGWREEMNEKRHREREREREGGVAERRRREEWQSGRE